MSRKQIYLLDDDAAFVDSMRWMLEDHDYRVHGFTRYADALPVLQGVSPVEPACLLLDVRMPDIGGVDVFSRLVQGGIDLPVVFLTGHGDVALAVEVMGRGALSFLEKPVNPDRLIETLDLAFSANVQCRRQSTELRLLASERAQLIESLSVREAEVLNGIAEGLSAKVIAEKLCISVKTVDYHRAKLLLKLQVKNIAQMQRVVALHESEAIHRRTENA